MNVSVQISTNSDSSLISVSQKDELEKEVKVKIVEAGVTDVRFFPLTFHCHLSPMFDIPIVKLIFKWNKIQFCNMNV